jgi:hypothetical protein
MAEIIFKNSTSSYLGRNGIGRCYGVESLKTGNNLTLSPINSKGTAKCWMEIPLDEVPALIDGIKTAVAEGTTPLVRVEFNIGYTVDPSNPEAVEYAKGTIMDDIVDLVIRRGEDAIANEITMTPDPFATSDDIPEFIDEYVRENTAEGEGDEIVYMTAQE